MFTHMLEAGRPMASNGTAEIIDPKGRMDLKRRRDEYGGSGKANGNAFSSDVRSGMPGCKLFV
jgi:hypothetical protein